MLGRCRYLTDPNSGTFRAILGGTPAGTVTAAFNSDFVSRYGFGQDEFHRLKGLWSKGYLRKILARGIVKGHVEFDFSLVKNPIPFGNKLPRMLTIIGKLTKDRLPTIQLQQKLFDSFARYYLAKGGILFTTPACPKSIRRSKELGCTVLLSVGAHPSYVLGLVEEEYKSYQIANRHPAYRESIFSRQLEAFELADYFITPSEFAKETLVRNGIEEHRVYVNPFGVDNSRVSHPNIKPQGRTRFLFLADMTLMKGVQYLLEAWEGLRLRNSELCVAGRIGRDIKPIIKRYSSLDNVIFLGHSSLPSKLYSDASVFVLPSLVEAGIARVTLEAMAQGLPVITTRIASSIVRNGQDGFSIPIRDVDGLMDKMRYLHEHPDEVVRMGRNAQLRAAGYSWDRYSDRNADIVEEVWRRRDE